MDKFTIDVIRVDHTNSMRGQYRAIVAELIDQSLDDGDNEGKAIFSGDSPAACLGHAMFYLSTTADLEKGVKLDITNRE